MWSTLISSRDFIHVQCFVQIEIDVQQKIRPFLIDEIKKIEVVSK